MNSTFDFIAMCAVNRSIVLYLGQNFFISWFTGFFFSDLGSGDEKKKKSSENDQLTGHFQSFFFSLISPEKTVKLVRQTNSLF